MLTEGWARNILISMEYAKRNGTTGEMERNKQFLL